MSDTTSPTITMMTTADSISLLQGHDVGRLSLDVDGYPVALPVNYAFDEKSGEAGRIVIRTAPHSTIGSYEGRASLEVDHVDLPHGRAWSVLVRGDFGRLRGRKPNVDPDPFVSDRRTQWMQLAIREVDGRRFAGHWTGFTTDRPRASEPNEGNEDDELARWLDRAVVAAAGTIREQLARLRSVVAPADSTE